MNARSQRAIAWLLTLLSPGYAEDCGQISPEKNTCPVCDCEQGTTALPLSFRSCVPFREIRLRDLDGVGDFLGVPDPAFGRGSS